MRTTSLVSESDNTEPGIKNEKLMGIKIKDYNCIYFYENKCKSFTVGKK